MQKKENSVTKAKCIPQHVEHELPPLYWNNSKILLLGSIPSPASRKAKFYYGHPQNRFWIVLSQVLSEPAPQTVEQKKSMLKKHRIALWDVLESCTIIGASDTSIKNVVVNNISDLIKKSKVSKIFCTGTVAYKLYQKYCAKNVGIDAKKLPSTSPANCAINIKNLVAAYSEILKE